MIKMFRKWSRMRRYRVLIRQLRSTPASELHALGIAPEEIDRLALATSQA